LTFFASRDLVSILAIDRDRFRPAFIMKKSFSLLVSGLLGMTLLVGCQSPNTQSNNAADSMQSQPSSARQQLLELQRQRDNGIITDAQYQAQKNRLLN
jgi:hypothetical protein